MAYRFEPGETVPESVRRVATEELLSAADGLRLSQPANRDKAIHEARKSIKKTRGLLRLMRKDLGDFFKQENVQLRDVGRRLSDLRDASVIIETFDGVVKKYQGSLSLQVRESIRAELDRRKKAQGKAAGAATVLPSAADALQSVAGDVKLWPLRCDRPDTVESGLRRSWKRWRKARRTARRDPRSDNFHQWRKRTKDCWYHTRLLGKTHPDLAAREGDLKRVEAWLGEDHNLTVLCERIGEDPESFGAREDVDRFLSLAAKQQESLRKQALALKLLDIRNS